MGIAYIIIGAVGVIVFLIILASIWPAGEEIVRDFIGEIVDNLIDD